jgi:hypothetical protein
MGDPDESDDESGGVMKEAITVVPPVAGLGITLGMAWLITKGLAARGRWVRGIAADELDYWVGPEGTHRAGPATGASR